MLTDPIIIDNFTHLLGAWGLDRLADDGDVIFPLRMDDLTIHGERPPEGSNVSCRIVIRELERHRVRVDADLVGPDDRIWMTIRGWEDWRFHWPGRYRDGFRQPDFDLVARRTSRLALTEAGIAKRIRLARTPERHGAAGLARRPRTRPDGPGRKGCLSGNRRPRPSTNTPALGANRGQGSGSTPLAGSRASPHLPGRPDHRARPSGAAEAPIASGTCCPG